MLGCSVSVVKVVVERDGRSSGKRIHVDVDCYNKGDASEMYSGIDGEGMDSSVYPTQPIITVERMTGTP